MVGVAFTAGAWVIASAFLYLQWFHYMRQGYGISRMYFRATPAGQVAGSRDAVTDAVIYLVPIYGIAARSATLGDTFLGLPVKAIVLPPEVVAALGALAAMAVGAWVLQAARQIARGSFAPAYAGFVLSHIAIFMAAYVVIDNANAGWLAINVWHNFQYVLVVWMTNVKRFAGGIDPEARFLSRISQPRRVVSYFALVHRHLDDHLRRHRQGGRIPARPRHYRDTRRLHGHQLPSLRGGRGDLAAETRRGPRHLERLQFCVASVHGPWFGTWSVHGPSLVVLGPRTHRQPLVDAGRTKRLGTKHQGWRYIDSKSAIGMASPEGVAPPADSCHIVSASRATSAVCRVILSVASLVAISATPGAGRACGAWRAPRALVAAPQPAGRQDVRAVAAAAAADRGGAGRPLTGGSGRDEASSRRVAAENGAIAGPRRRRAAAGATPARRDRLACRPGEAGHPPLERGHNPLRAASRARIARSLTARHGLVAPRLRQPRRI